MGIFWGFFFFFEIREQNQTQPYSATGKGFWLILCRVNPKPSSAGGAEGRMQSGAVAGARILPPHILGTSICQGFCDESFRVKAWRSWGFLVLPPNNTRSIQNTPCYPKTKAG